MHVCHSVCKHDSSDHFEGILIEPCRDQFTYLVVRNGQKPYNLGTICAVYCQNIPTVQCSL